jgi:hypothetical protein
VTPESNQTSIVSVSLSNSLPPQAHFTSLPRKSAALRTHQASEPSVSNMVATFSMHSAFNNGLLQLLQ